MKKRYMSRRDRRDRAALALACGSIAAILACASLFVWLAVPGAAMRRPAETIGGPFTLTDDRGRPVTEHSFPGKYLVVYFGYTMCPDICPATLNTLAASLDRLGRKADRIQPLFVTIDPAHDTPAALHRYMGAFSTRFLGLSGTDGQLKKIADEYGVVRSARLPAGFDHSAVLYLMAPDGRFVAPIPVDASETTMQEAIEHYIS